MTDKATVLLSRSPGRGTPGHHETNRDTSRDSAETVSLRALAARVLGRDIQPDRGGTVPQITVPHPVEAPEHFLPSEVESDAGGAGAPTLPTVAKTSPKGEAHPWFIAGAARAALAVDTGLDIAELDRAWPASAWRRLYAARIAFWTLPRSDAYGNVTRHLRGHWIAWGDLQNRWHKRHGERPVVGLCAGCGEPTGNAGALTLNGYQTHLDRDPDCLVLHGEKLRAAADAGLKAVGLTPPEEP
jgi:hypothetical protein